MVDGELVALDKDGVSSFPALQAALSNGRDHALVFYLFDLLHLDGWDLRKCALQDRKDRLKGLDTWHGMLRYSDHHVGDAARMRQAACKMKLEGDHLQKSRRSLPLRPRPRLAESEMRRPRRTARPRLDRTRRQPHRPGRPSPGVLRSARPPTLRRRRWHRLLG